MPSAFASSADSSRADSISSFARCTPTMRGSVCSAPKSGTRPSRMNDRQKRARGDATMKSAASARLKPAPKAGPSTAATTARSRLNRRASQACASFMRWRQPSLSRSADRMPRRSPPAQNAAPDPVSTTARTARSRSISSMYRASPARSASSSAFLCAGRFSVIVATPSTTS